MTHKIIQYNYNYQKLINYFSKINYSDNLEDSIPN